MKTPGHPASCKCALCVTRLATADVKVQQATNHPPGHRCLECCVLRVALSGAREADFKREGFVKGADGKWHMPPELEAELKKESRKQGADPKLPTL